MPHFLGKMENASQAGICLLLHGDTNSGKTHSSITAPPRILHINKEPKDPRLVHSAIRADYMDLIDYVEFADFDDEQTYLNDLVQRYLKSERPYETIFHDGLTFSMINTKATLEEARFDKKEEQAKAEPSKYETPLFTDMAGIERKDWGTLASLTARSTRLLHQLSKFGLLVVSTAISTEYPKWNNTIKVAPSLLGQEFPKMVHGFYDTIGYIVEPFHIDRSGILIPPKVSFISTDGGFTNSYMVRANPLLVEAQRKYGPIPLDLMVISKIIRGQYKS